MTKQIESTITIGSDLIVNRVGFGAMQLTGAKVWGEYPDRDRGIALLRRLVEAGINYIDTADVYGPHTNELLIRAALHPYPDGLVIASKGGNVRGSEDYASLDAIGNRNYLRQSAQLSARRLGVEQIDVYYLHSGRATDTPFAEQIATLAELREQGLIRHIGLSNVTPSQLREARTIVDVAAVTALYNPSVRPGAEVLQIAERTGMVFSPWHPIKTDEGDNRDAVSALLRPLAAKYGATVPQVALAWQLHRSPATLAIPGTTSIAHLDENLAAASIRLTAAEVDAITALEAEPAPA